MALKNVDNKWLMARLHHPAGGSFAFLGIEFHVVAPGITGNSRGCAFYLGPGIC